MENQDNQYDGVETDVNEVERQQQEERKRKQADSKWRSVDPGKTAQMQWTGRLFKREASYEGSLSPKLGAETTEINSKNENKVFEVGANSSAARDMVRIVKKVKAEGKNPITVFVKRKGEGQATRYEISEAE